MLGYRAVYGEVRILEEVHGACRKVKRGGNRVR